MSFIDLDEWIEEREHSTVADLFKEKGEAYFRTLESTALIHTAEHLQSKNTPQTQSYFAGVIATGGGTPCFNDNMNWMNQHGVTVWLNVAVDVLVERLVHEKAKRPIIAALHDRDLHQFITDKLVERQPYYSKATITINEMLNTENLKQKIIDAQENV